MKRWLSVLALMALSLSVATASALAFVHVFDGLWEFSFRQSSAAALCSETDALANYRAVMDYLSPFSDAPFSLPSLPFSEGGARHFADCKRLFNGVYATGGVSVLLLIPLCLWLSKKQLLNRALRGCGAALTGLSAGIAAVALVAFQPAFTLFHKLFFSNDLWVFSPSSDPIITLLPASFFLLCALVILGTWLAVGVAQLLFGFLSDRRQARKGN
ncbi:MAG: TIGR01906 family membrane protein [Clostridia bacterium]|nr:TIGR01906 family membrane protein [Clostridia bacterium]